MRNLTTSMPTANELADMLNTLKIKDRIIIMTVTGGQTMYIQGMVGMYISWTMCEHSQAVKYNFHFPLNTNSIVIERIA